MTESREHLPHVTVTVRQPGRQAPTAAESEGARPAFFFFEKQYSACGVAVCRQLLTLHRGRATHRRRPLRLAPLYLIWFLFPLASCPIKSTTGAVGVLPALPDIREGTCVVDCFWLVRGLFCSRHSTIICFLYKNLGFLCKMFFVKSMYKKKIK